MATHSLPPHKHSSSLARMVHAAREKSRAALAKVRTPGAGKALARRVGAGAKESLGSLATHEGISLSTHFGLAEIDRAKPLVTIPVIGWQFAPSTVAGVLSLLAMFFTRKTKAMPYIRDVFKGVLHRKVGILVDMRAKQSTTSGTGDAPGESY